MITTTPLARHNFMFSSAIALLLTLVLSACASVETMEATDDATSQFTAMEPQEFTAASADGPAQHVPEPVLPAAIDENTVEGIRATVSYFWEAVDYGRSTGETHHIEEVTHYVCESCNQLIYKWQQIYADGSWAVLHGETALRILEIQQNYSADRDEEWVAVIFEMDEPTTDFYQRGELDANGSTEGGLSAGWWLEMTYDEDHQRWLIDWLDFDATLVE